VYPLAGEAEDLRGNYEGNLENHFLVLFAILTRISITGTSTSTPTIVARATGLFVPKRDMATATASSKKLDAPIIPAGAAIS